MLDDEIQTSPPGETGPEPQTEPEPRPVYAQPSLGQPPQFEGQTHFADQTPLGDQTHFTDLPSPGSEPSFAVQPGVGEQPSFTAEPALGAQPAFGAEPDLGAQPRFDAAAPSAAPAPAQGQRPVWSPVYGEQKWEPGRPAPEPILPGYTIPPKPPKPPVDNSLRYSYPTPPPVPEGRQKSRNTVALGIVVCVLALLVFVVGMVFDRYFFDFDSEDIEGGSSSGAWDDDRSDRWEDHFDHDDDGDDSGQDSRGSWGFPWSGTPWDDFEEGDDPSPSAESQGETTIPRAELDGSLTLDVRSAAGKEPLSYQEIYTRCLPSTVSITVYDGDGGGGTGTGIIMTEDGYILTCQHVVKGGASCEVTTWDDKTYDALLVGGDAQTDLAVLKIDARGLQPAEFGDSDELTVGDEALAIGDPLGTELRGTLTNGIISAINRNVTMNTYGMTLLQTTAALNSGNSGGPLLNIYGQVVGVNNMKMVSTDVTVEGLGFAVPTSVVKTIIPTLAAEGKVSRPVLGITCVGIDEKTAQRLGEPTKGLYVSSINPASNAEEQGLRVGDYIFSINGQEVVSVEEVRPMLAEVGIGGELDLVVLRPDEDGNLEELDITITLVDQADLK
ncbi:MAG: trypsin-like peptidase domain-containing protein [Oscillospiraceae bacterium]|nr:trypsin-like peptidase domain-containing protein [Oscillospiraceae bacterium]